MLKSITHLQIKASINIGEGVDWFAIALDEIRTRWILREKADCKQSRKGEKKYTPHPVKSKESWFRGRDTKTPHFQSSVSTKLSEYCCLIKGQRYYSLRRVVRYIQDALITKLGGKVFSSPPRSFFILKSIKTKQK